MKNKNIYIACISIVVVIAITVIYCIFTKESYVKKYDINAIREHTIRAYDDMRKMDFIDMTTLFGIDLSDEENSIFLTNIDLEKNVTVDTNMIIVINVEDSSEYYNIFRSFLDSYYLNTDEKELLDYYDKAILKQGEGYVYFLMGNDSLEFEKDINRFYY